MSSALGVLKWNSETFWKSTFYEFTAAMRGHLVASGVDLTPMPTREEVNEAFREHDNRAKAAMGADQN